ncbi:NAD(P)H-flavin reductase [Shewanella sp. D64]|uniref:flavin mononucleotide reductase LuxG n=1 Tax=unclassified Shewanella TaxID=196818 RepID=UPI0022BA689E|nr:MULTISPECIES: NAD(P)H-flavin reductase [unclassified Shewanella]MEC4724831.1 NAD(P)H-flavin reductase [Shewanella sp. D64]MEC4736375.1 NAD(P)H-flavin reductase [Shewanella sp. E94]WBJ97566.1 NAD(P)H-flavin reductase [Shewanella sp. MTB7]
MKMKCNISRIESTNNNIYKIYIKLQQPISFKAGQYIYVYLNDSKKQPFSIASCPTDNSMIELHIGSSNKNCSLDTMEFFVDALMHNSTIVIDAPHGEAWLRDDSNKPILLIAGGTGLSYINSILRNCLNRSFTQPIYVYWGVKNSGFLYADDELQALSYKYSNLKYVPVVLEDDEDTWLGKKGTVIDAVMDDFTVLTLFDIYVCGPNLMTKAAKEQLVAKRNANLDQMFSDAFAYM